MPVNVKKAKEKAQIFEDMVPWDSLEQFRQEEVEYSVQSPEDVEVALDLPNKIIPLYYDGIGDTGVKYNEAILSFVRGKDTPESAIEKIKKPAQEASSAQAWSARRGELGAVFGSSRPCVRLPL
ncbi:hypothetical protein LQV63_19375 [Paenibacillus profundus]|uniref:Uncharacterized protein n=1 Tax=Paenibacillus profundus TaxID=1173085 RepID=A0ABS8YMB4_9BACL|nr:hypothetical protein [Paenibacillus profundus]MCE5171465.1 hypothetical protein [Paenibacillus profundus]